MRNVNNICVEIEMKVPYPNKEGFVEFTAMTKASFLQRLKKKNQPR